MSVLPLLSAASRLLLTKQTLKCFETRQHTLYLVLLIKFDAK